MRREPDGEGGRAFMVAVRAGARHRRLARRRWRIDPSLRRLGLDGGTLALPGGVINTMVYPAYPPVQKPAERPQPAGDGGPAAEVLSMLKSWTWRRGETDVLLLLGWIGAAKIGGALHWRPNMWITGGKNTGKSTLQQVIGGLMGDGGLLQSSDATAAAIRQTLGYCSLPVTLDEAEAEAEAEEDNRSINALVKISRGSASGAQAHRGGGGGGATARQFILRTCILFLSIL